MFFKELDRNEDLPKRVEPLDYKAYVDLLHNIGSRAFRF